MERLTHLIARKAIKNHAQINDPEVRAAYGSLEAWTSIVGNLLLFAVKLVLGLMLHSVSVIADAIHTLTDTGTSLVILFGFRMARQPADRRHPFGHGRTEAIATLIVAVLLVVAGLEVLRSAFENIWHPPEQVVQIGVLSMAVLSGTIVAKELMAQFALHLGRIIQSDALKGDFWHHRSDVLTSLVVIAALIARQQYGWVFVDGVAGLLVAAMIVYSGYHVARSAIDPLLGTSPSLDLLQRIESIALSFEGVYGVHDVIVHRYGQLKIVSLHIEVGDDQPVGLLHDLSERVEDEIKQQLGCEVVIHIDPINFNHERYQEIRGEIARLVEQDERINDFHDVRLVGQGMRVNVVFDIGLDPKVKDRDGDAIAHELAGKLSQQVPLARFVIRAEPSFAFNNGDV